MARLINTWPVHLRHQEITLQPFRFRDGRAWKELRRRNAEWLRPWDATLPMHDPTVPTSFSAMVRSGNRDAKQGRSLPFVIWAEGRMVGQLSIGGIAWGSLRSAYIGYWIDREYAGRGIVPRAVAMAIDFSFLDLQLHRVEVNVRPENVASLRVVDKLQLREEGLRRRYLHIDGQWRDHRCFAMTSEERPGGVLPWLLAQSAAPESVSRAEEE